MATDAFAAADDPLGASWVLASLSEFGEGVGSIVPTCFASYARVFHPASLDLDDSHNVRPVRWAEVAAANDRQMHPAAEWGSLTGSLEYIYNGGQPGIWSDPPELGSPPRAVAERLVALLANYTSSADDCWFAVSDIWGARLHDNISDAPKFGTDQRRFFLLRGPLRSALSSPHSEYGTDRLPGLWWPKDRAWFVGSDVDLLSTYVGGSEACIAALVSDPDLEASRIPIEQGVSLYTDEINPLPPEAD
jgi:hypothetical protein